MAGVGWGWGLQNILLLFENSYLFACFFSLSVFDLGLFFSCPFLCPLFLGLEVKCS